MKPERSWRGTPAEQAELLGELQQGWGYRPHQPRLVCVDGKVVGNAQVNVGPHDPNWYRHPSPGQFDGKVKVGTKHVGWWEQGWQWKYKIV